MAGKQLLHRPTLLLDVIKKFDLKALYLPDRKRILIDSELPTAKQRWGEAHEVGHSITPWHEVCMHGDDQQTLRPACAAQIETEANSAAGRLLFLQDQFETMLLEMTASIKVVQELSGVFKNTMTSTLWRVVETLKIPAVGVISEHPRYTTEQFNAADPCKYFIRSRMFEERFGNLSEVEVFAKIRDYCKFSRKGPLGGAEVVLRDSQGLDHVFVLETFHNTHEALTLGIYHSARAVMVSV
jgi:hypothetical protein